MSSKIKPTDPKWRKQINEIQTRIKTLSRRILDQVEEPYHRDLAVSAMADADKLLNNATVYMKASEESWRAKP
jgi:hypothetical protein